MKRSFNFNMFDEDQTYNKVALVEQSAEPFGHKLVDVSSTFRVLTTDLAELSKEVEKAEDFAHAAAVNRLEIIAEQMKFLQSQAYKVVVELRKGLSLHHVACNFKKVPGRIYHLYQKPSGQKYFSMLSPEEWSISHSFLGSFRLESDMTWTAAENIKTKERNLKAINNVLNSDMHCQIGHNDNISMLIDSQSDSQFAESQSIFNNNALSQNGRIEIMSIDSQSTTDTQVEKMSMES